MAEIAQGDELDELDVNLGNDPDLPQLYVNKFLVSASETDIRIALGTGHELIESGKRHSQPKYKIAVYMSREVMIQLMRVFNQISQIDLAESDKK